MKVKDIISRVILTYHDEDYSRITKHQYLQLLDDALMHLVLTRPDVHTIKRVVQLEAGTKQQIPMDGYALVDIYANMVHIDGTEWGIGKPVFQVDRKDLDYFSSWHTAVPTKYQITEFAYDKRSPKHYWVSPPVADGETIHVEMEYSYGFPQYSELSLSFEDVLEAQIDVDELYRTPIVNYMLYLLFSTDSTSQFDTQIATKYEKSFYQGLGVEYSASVDVVPRIVETTLSGVGVPLNAVTSTPAQQS